MSLYKSIVAFLVLAASLVVMAKEDVVPATGFGKTYREAIDDALVSALQQKKGIILSSELHTFMSDKGRVESKTGSSRESKTILEESISRDLKKGAKGDIDGYEVLSSEMEDGQHKVTVAVRFKKPYAETVGLPHSNRRKMVVATFRPTGTTFSRSGSALGTADWARSLGQKLNEQLTQTRKFTMLDRDFDAEIAAEMARISASDAVPGEAVKLNQKLGTDYLVVGTIAFSDVAAPTVNPFTGETRMPASTTFAEVSYRVLLAPTGQLKWADTVRVDASAFAALDATQFITVSSEQAAAEICASILSAIYPFSVEGKTSSGLLVIGQGGKTVFVGERLTVFTLGEKVRDSRTGEVLDRIEDEIGTVEIVRVQEKLSYAKVLSGDASKMGKGCRVRREFVAQDGAASVLPESEPMVKPVEGGVFLPFGN
mgnify:CR=1 FL=1